MASSILRDFSRLLAFNWPKVIRLSPESYGNVTSSILLCGRRTLFSSEILGLENYNRQRASLADRMGDTKEKFSTRMAEYIKSEGNNTIFTDDLKTMVYMAETDEQVDTTVNMIRRFHTQNQDLKFSVFTFGPLVMRLLHSLKKPDLAFQLYMDKTMTGFFEQMSSCIILMDNLYEAKKYPQVLKTMETFVDRQQHGSGGSSSSREHGRYPADCITLAIAACYQMNTIESLERVIKLFQECAKDMQGPATIPMRALCYGAVLALKQNKPELAFEMLGNISIMPGRGMPVAYTNIKALTLLRLGRVDEAIQLMKSVVQRAEQDTPDHVSKRGEEIFEEVLSAVKVAVQKKEANKELNHQLDIIERSLRQGGHIAAQTVDEYLLRPILRQRRIYEGYKDRDRFPPRQMSEQRGDWFDRRREGDAADRRREGDGMERAPGRREDRPGAPRREWVDRRGEDRGGMREREEGYDRSGGRNQGPGFRQEKRGLSENTGRRRFERPGLSDRNN